MSPDAGERTNTTDLPYSINTYHVCAYVNPVYPVNVRVGSRGLARHLGSVGIAGSVKYGGNTSGKHVQSTQMRMK